MIADREHGTEKKTKGETFNQNIVISCYFKGVNLVNLE